MNGYRKLFSQVLDPQYYSKSEMETLGRYSSGDSGWKNRQQLMNWNFLLKEYLHLINPLNLNNRQSSLGQARGHSIATLIRLPCKNLESLVGRAT